jgi:hypothetical protein
MSLADLAGEVQFTLDQYGKVTAVVLSPDAWEHILTLLEDREDQAILAALAPRLAIGPAASGALPWRDVRDDWK